MEGLLLASHPALQPLPPSHQNPGAGAARSSRALVSSRRSTQRTAQRSPALFLVQVQARSHAQSQECPPPSC